MTHNTREVEEIIEEKIKGYYEDIEQHERTKQAIKNKEIVYIGEFGNVLCEEDYFAWEEWVDSVAIGGSSREKFIKVNLNLHQQLQKARQDWLREEIEKLKGMKTADYPSSLADPVGFTKCLSKNNTLQTIIDRYHSELDQPTPWQCGKCTQERDGVKGDEIPEHHRSCKQRTELDQDNKYKIN